MGREVWIYSLDKEAATQNLNRLLETKLHFSVPLAEFIRDRKSEIGTGYDLEYAFFAEIKTEDLYKISPYHLFELSYWLREANDLSAEEEHEFLSPAGITLLYESRTSSEAQGFMSAYYDYRDFFLDTDQYPEISNYGITSSSEHFRNYLDYFILLLDEIKQVLKKPTQYVPAVNEKIKRIRSEGSSDQEFKHRLKYSLDSFKELYHSAQKSDSMTASTPYVEFELLIRNEEFLYKSLKMRVALPSTKAKILIIDSI